jgi:hypothetical protein
MTQADSVHSTPPTNTSATDPTRRRFLAVAAVASAVSAGTLAAAAAMDPSVPAAVTSTPRHSRPDPAFALIAEKLAADVAHGVAIDAQDEAEDQHGDNSDEAFEAAENCEAACHLVNEVDWRLATTQPTTIAGVAAVLRFANEIEDGGMEWPATDAIGPEGWHYQLRATMAAALEALINAQGAKAVRS